MPLYRFTPVEENLNHEDWQASISKRSCYVNARDVSDAAGYMHREFAIAANKNSQGKIKNPWRNPELVTVNEMAHMSGDLPPVGMVMLDK